MSDTVTSGPRDPGEAVAVAHERATLEALLDLYRDIIKRKVDGTTGD
jgi:hypothetical protein